MKTHTTLTAFFLTLFFISPVAAGKIYTWTDEKGVVHMTNEPPPKNIKVDKVTSYKEEAPREEDQIEREINRQDQELLKYRKQREAEAARMKAIQAEKDAQAAVQRADEVYKQSMETIEIYTKKNKRHRKQFRKKIERAKTNAQAAQAEAKAAVERSEEAAKAAEAAEKEAAAVDDGD